MCTCRARRGRVHHDAPGSFDGGKGQSRRWGDELARVDAGHWFTPPQPGDGPFPFRGRGFGVPRLREVLARYPGVPLIIELKVNDPELARRTVDDIRAEGAIDRVSFGSFGWRVLHAARSRARIHRPSKEEVRGRYRSWLRGRAARRNYRSSGAGTFGGTRSSRRFIGTPHRAVCREDRTVDDPQTWPADRWAGCHPHRQAGSCRPARYRFRSC